MLAGLSLARLVIIKNFHPLEHALERAGGYGLLVRLGNVMQFGELSAVAKLSEDDGPDRFNSPIIENVANCSPHLVIGLVAATAVGAWEKFYNRSLQPRVYAATVLLGTLATDIAVEAGQAPIYRYNPVSANHIGESGRDLFAAFVGAGVFRLLNGRNDKQLSKPVRRLPAGTGEPVGEVA